MTIKEKLRKFTFEIAFPYIIQQPIIQNYFENLCFLLVGSAATGLCSEKSDVDICILCTQDIFEIISINTRWLEGRPTETMIDGIQLHYYAISIENVIDKIKKLDDVAHYVYGNAIVIKDKLKLE